MEQALSLYRPKIGASTVSLSPLQCANLAKRLRGDARAARLAGDYPRATVLYRMAATCQVQAVLPC